MNALKSLFDYMKNLAENSPAPLFTSFQDDLYKQDKDVVLNDFLPGDTWYFGIKACGTYLVLADKNSEFVQELMTPKFAPERRHFLIRVGSQFEGGFEVKEYTMDTIKAAVDAVRINPDRKAPRQFGSEILFGLAPMFRNSVLMSDFTMNKGAVLYLSLNNNSASYVTKDGKARTVGLPFSFERKTGTYKITITTEFGHGVCEPIKMGVFTRAQKSYTGKKAA